MDISGPAFAMIFCVLLSENDRSRPTSAIQCL